MPLSTLRRWLGREDRELPLRRRAEAVLAQPWAQFLWNNEEMRDVMPWYFARGEGARLWDENGREFVDIEMGLGPTLLGHNHPVVREALREHAGAPIVSMLLHRYEVEVAEHLTAMFPSAERVVFGKNGSDACTAAARVARAATGRYRGRCARPRHRGESGTEVEHLHSSQDDAVLALFADRNNALLSTMTGD